MYIDLVDALSSIKMYVTHHIYIHTGCFVGALRRALFGSQ